MDRNSVGTGKAVLNPSSFGGEATDEDLDFDYWLETRWDDRARLTLRTSDQDKELDIRYLETESGVVKPHFVGDNPFDGESKDYTALSLTDTHGQPCIKQLGTLYIFGRPTHRIYLEDEDVEKLQTLLDQQRDAVAEEHPNATELDIPEIEFEARSVVKRGVSDEERQLVLPVDDTAEATAWNNALYNVASLPEVADNLTEKKAILCPFDDAKEGDTFTLLEVIDGWPSIHPRDVRDDHDRNESSTQFDEDDGDDYSHLSHDEPRVWEDTEGDGSTTVVNMEIEDSTKGVTYHVRIVPTDDGFGIEPSGYSASLGENIPEEVADYAHAHNPLASDTSASDESES